MINCVVIVLGAAQTPDGTPSPAMVRRLESACSYAYELGGADLLLSGGYKAGNLQSEAALMASLALERGIESHRLYLEDKSTTTYENARNCLDILQQNDWQKVYVVTDHLHLRRTRLCFHKLGIKAYYLAANKSTIADSRSLLYRWREFIAFLWYKLKL